MAVMSGKFGSVTVGTVSPVTHKFQRWSYSIDGDDPETTNFTSGGAYEDVAGIDKGTIDINGLLDTGNVGLQRGEIYTWNLGVGGGYGFTVLGRLKNITPSQDVKGKGELKLTVTQQGPFTPIVL
jgi:hypothetical protein